MAKGSTEIWERLHPGWVGLVGFALYARTLRYGFVLHDDPWLVRDNALLRELSPGSVWHMIADFSWEQRHRLGAEYLPVRDLSVMLDYAIYGDWVGGHHLTQVLLYAGTCSVLATLALALTGNRTVAWLSGLFYATHPVHVEVVAWLSERKGALGSFLVALSLLLATSYLKRGGTWRAVLGCVVFTLAVASKALVIAGVGALLLFMLWVESPLPRRSKVLFALSYAICGALVFVPNVWVSQSMGVIVPYHGEGFADTLALFFETQTLYLRLMIFGGPYSIEYGIAPGSHSLLDWLPGAVSAAVGLVVLGWGLSRPDRRGAVSFGIGWWFVFLAPVSHLLVPVQNYAADRYLFLPSFGLLLAFAALLWKLPRWVVGVVGSTVVVIGCLWTIVQTPVWSTTDNLYRNAVDVTPSYAAGWDKLASSSARRGAVEAAWSFTERGLQSSPRNWQLLHRQGLLLAKQGRLDDAIETMERAAAGPESHKAYANLALLYLKRGRRADALRVASQAAELQPNTAHNQRVLGIVTYELEDKRSACRAFDRAFALDPYHEDNQKNLSLCVEANPESGADRNLDVGTSE